jgi:hypothetical protein
MMITTRNLKQPAAVEPKKLNIITTAIIPNVPKDAPAPVGDGFAKMITTHDEPKAAPGAPFVRDVDDMAKDKVEVKLGEPFDPMKTIYPPRRDVVKIGEPIDAPLPVVPAPAPKPRKPRKAKKG